MHIENTIDPVRDKEIIDTELQLKDLETVDKKLEKVKRASRTGNKEAQKEELVLLKLKEGLETGISVRAIDIDADSRTEFVKPL